MRSRHLLAVLGLFVLAAIAVDNYQRRPTLSTGLQAVYAALQAALALG